MSQAQIDQRMIQLQQAEAEGRITWEEMLEHIEVLKREIRA
jgi:hypothetical protein